MLLTPLVRYAAVLVLALTSASVLASPPGYTFRQFTLGVAQAGASTPPPIPGSVCADGKAGCAIWNAADKSVNIQVTNALAVTTSGACYPGCPSQYGAVHATVGKSTGAHYWEVKSATAGGGWWRYPCGISPAGGDPNFVSGYDQPGGYGFADKNPAANDTYGCLLNLSENTFSWTRNGVFMEATSIAPGTYFPSVSAYGTDQYSANFGQNAFQYAVPAGYAAGVR